MSGHRTAPRAPAAPAAPAGDRVRVSVETDRCVGCLACATVCKPDALRLLPGTWAVEADPERCTACRRCESACPFGAIEVTGEPRNRRRIVVDALRSALASSCPTGWQVPGTPPAFRLSPGHEPVVPDAAVVRLPQRGAEWVGTDEPRVPLVVDVVAGTAKAADLAARRELYWQCGVATYWTVDQRSGEVTVQWSVRPGWFDPWARFAFPGAPARVAQ